MTLEHDSRHILYSECYDFSNLHLQKGDDDDGDDGGSDDDDTNVRKYLMIRSDLRSYFTSYKMLRLLQLNHSLA